MHAVAADLCAQVRGGEPFEAIAFRPFANDEKVRSWIMVVHEWPGLNQRRMPLLWLEAPHHRRDLGAHRNAEFGAERRTVAGLVEALKIDPVIDAADRRGVALFCHELMDDRVTYGDQAIDARRDLLEVLSIFGRAEPARVHG